MTQSGLRSKLLGNENKTLEIEGGASESSATAKVFQGQGPALKNWKISATPEEFAARPKISMESFDFAEEEIARIREAHNKKFDIQTPKWLQITQYVSIFATVAWLTYNAVYIASIHDGFKNIIASPTTIGSISAAILAPIALLWLCVATWQRRSDAHLYAEALRVELQRLLFPTEDQARAVNRDIQLLVQQAVEISTSSRAALKAIQRARQGLRSEIRDFSGVSQKTEFHIDRLADTLNKRADELLKITDQIEQRSKNIQEEVKTGVEVWSEISEEALEKVSEIQTEFDKSTQHFESQTEKLNVAAQKLTLESGKLGEQFESEFLKLENLGAKGVQSFGKITDELEKFDGLSEGIFARAEVVERNLTRQAENMKTAAGDLTARVTDLDSVGTTAANKLGEALAMALSGSDSIVSAVRRAREQLEKAATETSYKAADMMEQTDLRIEKLSSSAAERLGRIQDLLSGFDHRQQDIANILEQLSQQNENVGVITDTALDRLTSAVHLLDQSATTLDIKSAKPVTDIREATEVLAQQVERIHESLQTGVNDIDVNTAKAKQAAEEIARTLKQHTHDLVLLSGQVTSHSRSINGQFDDHKEKLANFIEATESRIDNFESRLGRQIETFSEAVDTVETDIEKLGVQLEEKGRKAVEETTGFVGDLQTIEARVEDSLASLSAQTMQTQLTIQDYEAGIRSSVEATLPLYEKIVSGAQDIDNRFDRVRDSVEASSSDIFARMEALSRELEQQIERLNTEVENSERSLTSLSGGIKGSVSNIENSADQANEKLKLLHTSLLGRTEDLQILADQAEVRIGNLQKTFDVNTSEIKGALTQATEKLEEATGQFERSSDTIQDRSETSARKIEMLSNLFIEEGHRLAMTGEQTVYKTSRILSQIQDDSMDIAQKATVTLDQLQKAGDGLAVRAREIEEYSKAALNSTSVYNDSLKQHVRIIAETSAQVVDTIGDSVSNLQAEAEEAARQGDKIVEKVERARQSLGKESERLDVITKKATEAAEEAAIKFSRHSSVVVKSVEDISSHAERIRDLQIRSSREAFLSSAKFIIESLHSLSVDVSRHLEDDVDDRSWRAYQKGDVAVFTRRLVRIADEVPMERVRRKFAEDSEFRNYTQRYMRQFEELFESAQNNDHGELLSSIFVSSDVGKLYRLLCDISGRAAKIG